MQIASFVDDISISQCSYDMITNFNQLCTKNIDVCCFYLNLAPIPTNMNFALINSYYLPHWNGAIFSTSLQTAHILQKVYSKNKHFLYLQNLEWLTNPGNFFLNSSILRNKDTVLIARSHSHVDAIYNYCNVRAKHIIKNWDHQRILEIVNEYRTDSD